jgi:hypothetical protein
MSKRIAAFKTGGNIDVGAASERERGPVRQNAGVGAAGPRPPSETLFALNFERNYASRVMPTSSVPHSGTTRRILIEHSAQSVMRRISTVRWENRDRTVATIIVDALYAVIASKSAKPDSYSHHALDQIPGRRSRWPCLLPVHWAGCGPTCRAHVNYSSGSFFLARFPARQIPPFHNLDTPALRKSSAHVNCAPVDI